MVSSPRAWGLAPEAWFLCRFTFVPRSILCSVLYPRGQTWQNTLHPLSCSLVSHCVWSWEHQWKIRRWEEEKMGVTVFPSAPCLTASLSEAVFLYRDSPCWVASHSSSCSSSQALVPRSPLRPIRPRGGMALQLSAVANQSLSTVSSIMGPHPTYISITNPFTNPCGCAFCFLPSPWWKLENCPSLVSNRLFTILASYSAIYYIQYQQYFKIHTQ